MEFLILFIAAVLGYALYRLRYIEATMTEIHKQLEAKGFVKKIGKK